MKTTVAVAQIGTRLGDAAATLDAFDRACADCAAQGAQMAVFPEALIGGYPKGLTFGASLGIRTPAGRALFRAYAEEAVAVPGPVVERIGAIARRHGLLLVVGVVERDGGTLYCTVIYVDADGTLLGKHRKLVPTAVERVVWGG